MSGNDMTSEGGDPACWLADVCPECGLYVEDPQLRVCPRCGEALPTSG